MHSRKLCIFLLLSITSCWSVVSGLDETKSGPNGCVGTADSVISAINASNSYMLTEVIINCLAYEDDSYTIAFGVLSYEDKNGARDRSNIECLSGLLVLSSSLHEYSVAIDNCYQCQDMMENETCVNDASKLQTLHIYMYKSYLHSIFIVIYIYIIIHNYFIYSYVFVQMYVYVYLYIIIILRYTNIHHITTYIHM